MSGSKYYDTNAVLQVIGSILNDPLLFDNGGQYFFNEEDFITDFHRVVFGAINNLLTTGGGVVNIQSLDNYFKDRPNSKAIYENGGGPTKIKEIQMVADMSNFDYYYNRLKKMTLLRTYDQNGLDVKFIYDPDALDTETRQRQINRLDKMSLNEIADLIENKMVEIRQTCIDNAVNDSDAIGKGLLELIEGLKDEPDMGPPMYGPYINAITRGMRSQKFYLRSAATGVGKSRSMIADACYSACDSIWDTKTNQWINCGGIPLSTIFISTELDLAECQTMAVAFISGVNEEHIISNKYDFGEEERIKKAVEILSRAPLYIELMPDFSLRDIENSIKRNIRLNHCQIVILDYIHTSMKILEEISRRSGGVRLREDNILFLLSVKLKDLANEYGVFILSATQLNESWKNEKIPDQNMLRGAKSIADWAKFYNL